MNKFNVGDTIVENGRVYTIFKIDVDEKDGNEIRTIYFKPLFDDDNALIGSIPVQNIEDGEIRTPATLSQINDSLKLLSKKRKEKIKLDTDLLEEKLKTNKILDIAKVANLLWGDKKNEDTSFSPTKRRLFKKAVRSICEEYAHAKDTSLEKAEKTIQTYLRKSL